MGNSADDMKRAAAQAALELVEDGMTLGLGTGSTAAHFVRGLGPKMRSGVSVRGVPTSEATAHLAREAGVPLLSLDQVDRLDLTVDGADELDGQLRLIKGGGAALLREKIVAAASRRMVVIADGSKAVERLGAYPLPVEIVPFGAKVTARAIEAVLERMGFAGEAARARVRQGADNVPLVTDGGNWIVDLALESIAAPEALAAALNAVPGVVEHGLFLDLAHEALIAEPTGVRRITVATGRG